MPRSWSPSSARSRIRTRLFASLARVLKPGGRLVVGELLGDPHYVRLAPMRLRAGGVGLAYERRVGNALGYFARFVKG